MLINFADSAFTIGESHTLPNMRYLKQIKQRSTHEQYGANNVCMCRIIKAGHFLGYEFTGHATEREHLGRYDQVKARIHELTAQGLSQRQIAIALQISAATVNRILQMGKMDKVV
jgi:DNA-binding NarL/FixJ family response regulator